jgi:AAA+ ATPase superfamily predicted ATPase
MVALIGRRRVGKTHLIKQVFGQLYDFEMTSIQHASTATLLANFSNKLNQYANPPEPISPPKNWLDAFTLLKQHLSKKEGGPKK